MMETERFRFGMRLNRPRFSSSACLFGHNRNRALWTNDVFDKKSGFTDHRPPPCFIPPYRTVFKTNLQLTIVVVTGRDIFREPGADGIHLYGLGARHLTHYVDIVYAAIHYRTQALHQVPVEGPHLSITLLVEIHSHDERFAQFMRQLDKTFPGGVMAQNIAHH